MQLWSDLRIYQLRPNCNRILFCELRCWCLPIAQKQPSQEKNKNYALNPDIENRFRAKYPKSGI